MDKSEDVDQETLAQIASSVGGVELKLMENEALQTAVTKASSNYNRMIADAKADIKKMEDECVILEEHNKMLDATIQSQLQSIAAQEQSIMSLTALEHFLDDQICQNANKYKNLLDQFEYEINDHEEWHLKNNPAYRELKQKEAKLKFTKVQIRMLEFKIENSRRSKKQYDDIQKRNFQQKIVKFAQFYVDYHRLRKAKEEAQELAETLQKLLKEQRELEEEVKKNQTVSAYDYNIRQRQEEKRSSEKEAAETPGQSNSSDNGQQGIKGPSSQDMFPRNMDDFISKTLQPLYMSYTNDVIPVDPIMRQPRFTEPKSKVTILDARNIKMPLQRPTLPAKIVPKEKSILPHQSRTPLLQKPLSQEKRAAPPQVLKKVLSSKPAQVSSVKPKPKPLLKSNIAQPKLDMQILNQPRPNLSHQDLSQPRQQLSQPKQQHLSQQDSSQPKNENQVNKPAPGLMRSRLETPVLKTQTLGKRSEEQAAKFPTIPSTSDKMGVSPFFKTPVMKKTVQFKDAVVANYHSAEDQVDEHEQSDENLTTNPAKLRPSQDSQKSETPYPTPTDSENDPNKQCAGAEPEQDSFFLQNTSVESNYEYNDNNQSLVQNDSDDPFLRDEADTDDNNNKPQPQRGFGFGAPQNVPVSSGFNFKLANANIFG